MKTKNWFLENLEMVRDTFDYRLENILLDVGENIALFMEEKKLSRAQMAKRLGVSRAYVTKILNGNPNLTIKTLLKLSDVLEKDLKISFGSKYINEGTTTPKIIPIQFSELQSYCYKPQKIHKASRDLNDCTIAA